MEIEQRNKGNGDNVAGNKYINIQGSLTVSILMCLSIVFFFFVYKEQEINPNPSPSINPASNTDTSRCHTIPSPQKKEVIINIKDTINPLKKKPKYWASQTNKYY